MTALPLKHVAHLLVSNVDKKALDNEVPVRLCNYVDVYNHDDITADLEFMEATATPEQVRRFSLHGGDVAFTKDSETAEDIGVPAFVPESLPGVVYGYHLAIARADPVVASGRYLFWALSSNVAREHFAVAATGVTRFGLRQDDMGNVRLPIPPLPEQRTIADFLDRETARIDALIAAKRRMIDLVEARYRSLVSALTDQGPPIRVRHVTSLRTSGPRGWAERVGESGRPFIRSANLQRDAIDLRADNLVFVNAPETIEAARSRTRQGDVLIGITGANTGWVARVTAGLDGGYVSQHVAILRPRDVVPDWLAYSLFSERSQQQLLGSQYGGTKQQLGLEDLADLSIGDPPREAQVEAVNRIEASTAWRELLSRGLLHQIDLLAERRQALITVAVTGELGVPGVAA
jgi:type I restriction enzyme S subunit